MEHDEFREENLNFRLLSLWDHEVYEVEKTRNMWFFSLTVVGFLLA